MFYFSLQTRHDPSIGAFTRSNFSFKFISNFTFTSWRKIWEYKSTL